MRISRARLLFQVTAVAAALTVAACGSDKPSPGTGTFSADAVATDPGPIHVHGLGINPSDGALFVATHTGLFRSAPGEKRSRRVGGRFQDTMGFTVIGPDRFLGSGHPDLRDKLPPFLGLIRSGDAGRSWDPVSLLGDADFHVLEAQGQHVYGAGSDFGTRAEQLLVSDDGGKQWDERTLPGSLLALAIRPGNPGEVVASGEAQLYASPDGGSKWRPVAGEPGLLAWPAQDRLFALGFDGTLRRSADAGRSWEAAGSLGGEPAAFEAAAPGELYAALHDGTIKRSGDGGKTWSVRARP